MNLKSLKHAMRALLKKKVMINTPEECENKITDISSMAHGHNEQLRDDMISTRDVQFDKHPEWPLASACDVGIFPLFDLPTELVKAVISEMVEVDGFKKAVRLRAINSELPRAQYIFTMLTY